MRLRATGSGSDVSTGLDKALPAASAGLVDTYYVATDSKVVYKCVAGPAWEVVRTGTPDKSTVGGFTATNWIGHTYHPGTAPAPLGALGYTWLLNFHCTGLPGVGGGVLWSNSHTAGASGWGIAGSATAANTMRLIGSMDGGLQVAELPEAALSVGAHTLALALTAGKVVNYAWDGVLKTPTAIAGTAWTAPSDGFLYRIGMWSSGAFDANWVEIGQLATYTSALADADLITLSANPANYRPASISATHEYLIRGSWYVTSEPSPQALVALTKTNR